MEGEFRGHIRGLENGDGGAFWHYRGETKKTIETRESPNARAGGRLPSPGSPKRPSEFGFLLGISPWKSSPWTTYHLVLRTDYTSGLHQCEPTSVFFN